ncbi:MAG: hypothetical protein HFG63_15685 [Lachnospiraceae bacterium]|nr:hypothetical protein [Lachnospiraceae bacterium]
MYENLYKMAGNVAIPEEKREEFNQHVLQILYKGGIRKTEQVELDGKSVTVVGRPVPDQQGIVSFDYSIFEKKKRETATYNTNTGKLIIPDKGYREFGLVMSLIMTMQEAYSKGQCYLMSKDKPCRVDGYVAIIKGMLGIDLDFSHRAKMWDMLLFLKNIEEYENVTAEIIWDAYSFDLCPFIPEQFFAVYSIDSKEIPIPEEPFCGEKNEIKDASAGKLKYYVYQIICRLVEEKREEGLEPFLKKLLDADLSGRKALAEDRVYGTIAEVSLYVLPSVIVHAYGAALKRDFWDVWKALGIKGYSEIIIRKRARRDTVDEEERWILPFYKVILRQNEDEFLEFWEDEILHFSEDMKACLSDWEQRFQRIRLEEEPDIENYLVQIVADLDRDWGCCLVDKAFITEFIEHKNEDSYKKALLLYREIMDEDTAYFPELTKKQAIRWMIRQNRYEFDFTAMSAFQSLLTNHKHRFEILGF